MHVVVLGTDTRGRSVRLSLKDCERGRQIGDDYLCSYGLLDKTPDRARSSRERDADGWLTRVLAITKNALTKLARSRRKDKESRNIEERRSMVAGNSRFIGAAPNWVAVELARRTEDRRRRERRWSKYSEPIEISYPGLEAGEIFQFTWQTPLKTLRALEREYLSGTPFICQAITAKQFKKLQSWIKHSWRETKRLQEGASSILRIEVDFIDGRTETYNAESRTESLLDLYELAKVGELFLQDHEEAAVENWILRSTGSLALKDTPTLSAKQRLQFLCRAYRRNDSWATNAITKEEFEMLQNLLGDQRHGKEYKLSPAFEKARQAGTRSKARARDPDRTR